jgi:uncharacterized protein (TIGR03067 family)
MKTVNRRSLSTLFALAVMVGAAAVPAVAQQASAPQAVAAPAATAPLQGVWVVTAAEMGGKPFDAIVGGRLTIEGLRFSLVTASGNKLDGVISLDPAKSPKQLDFNLTAGAVWLAIYTVSDKTLRLNYVEAADGGKRPTEFATSSELTGTVIALRKAD